jgi:soluble lytic murein transglycosylase
MAYTRHRTMPFGRRRPKRSRRSKKAVRRRRRRRLLFGFLALLAGLFVAVRLTNDQVSNTLRELTLPLRHEDIIRQQANRRDLDPALIAAMIYQESKFEDRTSHAGARGLMQITPSTAEEIERLSGGSTFTPADLADPDLNIRYGTFYLRYLIDLYDGNEVAAVAAYNAGPTQVNGWGGSEIEFEDIAIPETAEYVKTVFGKKDEYAEEYSKELGTG